MFIMVISLLLSITVGNVLHAMEAVAMEDLSDNLGTSLTGSSCIGGVMTTLNQMRELSKQVHNGQQTRGRNRENLTKPSEIEIPDNVKIDWGVFKEWANVHDLAKKSKPPGCFERIFCCRSRENNLFKCVPNNQRQEWAKTMLAIYRQENYQTEVETRGRLNDSGDMTESDDDSEVIRGLENKLKQIKMMRELNKKIRNVIEREQKEEDEGDELKKVGYALLGIVGAFVGGMYGICPS